MIIGEKCTFRRKAFRVGPSSTVITIPRGLDIEPGDEVEVTVRLIEKHKNAQGDKTS